MKHWLVSKNIPHNMRSFQSNGKREFFNLCYQRRPPTAYGFAVVYAQSATTYNYKIMFLVAIKCYGWTKTIWTCWIVGKNPIDVIVVARFEHKMRLHRFNWFGLLVQRCYTKPHHHSLSVRPFHFKAVYCMRSYFIKTKPAKNSVTGNCGGI